MAVSAQERWKEHNETGRRHFERAEFAEAEQAYIAALRQATLLGAVTLTELGQVAFSLRDFQQSESYFRRALTIREQALGTESLDLMQALNDLAAPYYSRGELEQAERLYRRALTIGEIAARRAARQISTVTLSNLARLHQRRGRLARRGAAARPAARDQAARARRDASACGLAHARGGERAQLAGRARGGGGARAARARAAGARAGRGRGHGALALGALEDLSGEREDAAGHRARGQARRSGRSASGSSRERGTRARASIATRPTFRWASADIADHARRTAGCRPAAYGGHAPRPIAPVGLGPARRTLRTPPRRVAEPSRARPPRPA